MSLLACFPHCDFLLTIYKYVIPLHTHLDIASGKQCAIWVQKTTTTKKSDLSGKNEQHMHWKSYIRPYIWWLLAPYGTLFHFAPNAIHTNHSWFKKYIFIYLFYISICVGSRAVKPTELPLKPDWWIHPPAVSLPSSSLSSLSAGISIRFLSPLETIKSPLVHYCH